MTVIKFENVKKSYNGQSEVITNLNLSIDEGEFVVLIGPSGCGKTTMLKLINGLIKPDNGNIYLKGKELKEWDNIELKRNIGYVIQHVGLFPHMKVIDNISYVLNIKKEPIKYREERAKELISLVGLDKDYLNRYPRELSGGEKQRVGLARALAADPDIILMDEPLGAVDEITRRVLQDEIQRIYFELKKTIVFVTHDIQEAIKLGTKIILFNNGVIEQMGTKEEMIFKPSNEYVKEFFKLKNFTAYLNVTSIEHVYTHIYKPNISNDNPSIYFKSTIMEGIKLMFDKGADFLYVYDDTGEIIGHFSMSEAFTNIKKLLVNS